MARMQITRRGSSIFDGVARKLDLRARPAALSELSARATGHLGTSHQSYTLGLASTPLLWSGGEDTSNSREAFTTKGRSFASLSASRRFR
jgi:hypothetical protein